MSARHGTHVQGAGDIPACPLPLPLTAEQVQTLCQPIDWSYLLTAPDDVIDAELRAMGEDPQEVGERGLRLIRGLKAGKP